MKHTTVIGYDLKVGDRVADGIGGYWTVTMGRFRLVLSQDGQYRATIHTGASYKRLDEVAS